MNTNIKNAQLKLNLSIDEKNKIKEYANQKGKSVEEFVMESVNNQILLEADQEYTNILSKRTSLLLKDLWNNDKDAAYDNL